MTAAYSFDLTCPACDQPVIHEALGTSDGFQARAVARCTNRRKCGRRWGIRVHLFATTSEDECACSTESGYYRHVRNGEEACPASRIAHADAEAARKRRRKEREQCSLPL